MNKAVNSITELQDEVHDLRSKAEYRDKMALYGHWVMYFAKNIVVHELRGKALRIFGKRKVTWPLVWGNMLGWNNKDSDLDRHVERILKNRGLEMHDFVTAVEFMQEYCPGADDAHVHDDGTGIPSIKGVDPKYRQPLQLIMEAVQKELVCT